VIVVKALAVNVKGKGERTLLSIRPERVTIAPKKTRNTITLDGRVEELIYLGDHIRTRMSVAGHPDFIVKVPNNAGHHELKEGQTTTVAGSCRRLPRTGRYGSLTPSSTEFRHGPMSGPCAVYGGPWGLRIYLREYVFMKKLLTAGFSAFALAAVSTAASAEGSITAVSWGGAYTKSQVKAITSRSPPRPASKINSVDYSGGIAEVKAQVEPAT
jgi:hypothetical protein